MSMELGKAETPTSCALTFAGAMRSRGPRNTVEMLLPAGIAQQPTPGCPAEMDESKRSHTNPTSVQTKISVDWVMIARMYMRFWHQACADASVVITPPTRVLTASVPTQPPPENVGF